MRSRPFLRVSASNKFLIGCTFLEPTVVERSTNFVPVCSYRHSAENLTLGQVPSSLSIYP
jgi:hypothetical protein